MKPKNREGDGFAKNQISLSLSFSFHFFSLSFLSPLSREGEERTHSTVAKTVYRTVDSSVYRTVHMAIAVITCGSIIGWR